MANPKLNERQGEQANKLIVKIKKQIDALAKGNKKAVFAFRRKIYLRLIYDERGTPMERRKLKNILRKKQNDICPICRERLPVKNAVLDRIRAIKGYNEKNVKLICPSCDQRIQQERRYS